MELDDECMKMILRYPGAAEEFQGESLFLIFVCSLFG
jgi:hypothetical protein